MNQHISTSAHQRNFKSFNPLILILTIFITGLISCHNNKRAQNYMLQAVPVNLTPVQRQSIVYYDNYPATVTALKEVELRCEVGGNVTGMFFEEGQMVKKGQKLYEIDQSTYEAALNQAKANLDIAQSNLEKAQLDADRYTRLNQEDAIAKQTYDYALTAFTKCKITGFFCKGRYPEG